jgi:PKD repeat protein
MPGIRRFKAGSLFFTWIAVLAASVLCCACGGNGSSGVLEKATVLNSGGSAAELRTLLDSELARLGVDPGRVVAAVAGPGNAVFDLHATLIDPDGVGAEPPTSVRLTWTERLVGDYDQNGEVAVSDITPLALRFGGTVDYIDSFLLDGLEWYPAGDPDIDGGVEPGSPPANGSGAYNWRLARVDGDYNGEIGITDITPIAQHFGQRLDGYRVYRRVAGESDFTLIPGTGGLTIARGSESAPVDLTRPVRYEYSEDVSGFGPFEYYVAPYDEDSSAEGPASGLVTAVSNQSPVAGLTATPLSGREPLEVNFDASTSIDTDGDIVAYEWDFDGDGTFEFESGGDYHVQHEYAAAGTFNPVVRVRDDLGATATATVAVTVDANIAPTAVVSVSSSLGTAPMSVHFNAAGSADPDGGIVSYEWDFDGNGVWDENTGTFAEADFVYIEGGSYEVIVRVTDDSGASTTASNFITVNDVLNAAFTVTSQQGYAPLKVTFNAAGSFASEGIAEYRWNFNGTGDFELVGNDTSVTFTYTDSGIYNATLEIVDTTGATDQASLLITVARYPLASLSTTDTSGLADLSVSFNAAGSFVEVLPVTYRWDLDGDGTYGDPTDIGQMEMLYSTPGTLTASVIVIDGNGAQDTADVLITVEVPPVADLQATGSPFSSVVELSAAGSSDADGHIVEYRWDFDGDGVFNLDTGSDPDVSHNYEPGTYNPIVRVTDDDGHTADATTTVVVGQPT